MKLNENLAKQQKITEKQREKLSLLYEEIYKVFDEAKNDTNLEENGSKYRTKIKELEFQLQENWNFEKDELKHTWWNRVPGCTCPTMDNNERFGIEKIINCSCPIHNELCKEE
jgi:hypothetical protein